MWNKEFWRETIYYPRWLCKEMEIWGTRFFQVRCQGAKKYKHALHRLKAFLMDFTTQALTFKNGDINILIFKENSTFFYFYIGTHGSVKPVWNRYLSYVDVLWLVCCFIPCCMIPVRGTYGTVRSVSYLDHTSYQPSSQQARAWRRVITVTHFFKRKPAFFFLTKKEIDITIIRVEF